MRSQTAQLLQAALAATYVSSIYVHPNGRLHYRNKPSGSTNVKTRSRNDPLVIKTRLIAVSVATMLSCLAVGFAVWKENRGSKSLLDALHSTVKSLGLWPRMTSLRGMSPYFLVPLLYSGPLFTLFLESTLPFQRKSSFKEDFVAVLSSPQGLRNYIVSPITEEVVFRSCIIAIAHLADDSWRSMIFVSPLWFGFAHAHHAWETFNNLGRTRSAFSTAISGSLFQLAYTTLFGWFAAYLFVRTGSAYATCFSHIFCNFMGLPTIGRDIKVHPRHALMIWCMHIIGIIGFWYAVVPWTGTEG